MVVTGAVVAVAAVVACCVVRLPDRPDKDLLDAVDVPGYERLGDDTTARLSLLRYWGGSGGLPEAITVDGQPLNPPLNAGVSPDGRVEIGWLPPVGVERCQVSVFRVVRPNPADQIRMDLTDDEFAEVADGRLTVVEATVNCGGG